VGAGGHDAGNGDNGVDLRVELVEALGSESFIYGVPVLSSGATAASQATSTGRAGTPSDGNGAIDGATANVALAEPAAGTAGRVTVHSDKRVRPAVGDIVRVVPDAAESHIFSADTGERLTAAR
jgi:sn-glycerol 3-phosphate transport system ATP-binding protein/multiple sugar transport system ATP-binding protein